MLRPVLGWVLVGIIPIFAQPCAIHTIAGPATTFAGDGQAAAAAQFFKLHGLASDKSGVLYIADTGNNRIRRVLASGIVETVAGTGANGFSGDDGPARSAQLSGPEAVLPARDGSFYISDTQNHRIRRLGPDGVIQTIAGTGEPGFSGDGGLALLAQMDSPRGLATDSTGNLYFSDSLNNRVRRIDTGGTIRTVVGNGLWAPPQFPPQDGTPALEIAIPKPDSIAIDSHSNLYIEQAGLIRIDPQGLVHPVYANNQEGGNAISIASDDSVLILNGQSLRRLTPDGKVTEIAQGAFLTTAPSVAAGPGGQIYVDMVTDIIGVVAPGSAQVVVFAGRGVNVPGGDDGPASLATFWSPSGIAVGNDGSVYVADRDDQRVRRIGRDGIIRPFAGTGKSGYSGDRGPATQAQLSGPSALALDAAGNLYIANNSANGSIRMVQPDGIISTVLGGGTTEVITTAPPPHASLPGASVKIAYPVSVALASDGTLWVTAFDSTARYEGTLQVTGDGQVTLISWSPGSPFLPPLNLPTVYPNDPAGEQPFDNYGNAYSASTATSDGRLIKRTRDGASGIIYNADLKGFSGEMGLDSAARDIVFAAITGDNAGNVYVADGTGRVLQVEAAGCPLEASTLVGPSQIVTGWTRSNPFNLLAPGSLVSLYGSGLGPDTPAAAMLDANGLISKQLAGVRVLFNGVPAPLLYVSSTQINAIAPFSVLRDRVLVEIECDGVKSGASAWTASPAALSVFPAAINEDGTLNSQSNPARLGSVVTIWVSGLGSTDPPGVDGRLAAIPLARPVLPLSIDLGQQRAEILYAGDAPGTVEGVMQINLRIPTQPGPAIPVLTVGSDSTSFVLYY